ncbi:MAG: hypothetical protein AB7G68_08515 [Nitrospiraceae bacterium]
MTNRLPFILLLTLGVATVIVTWFLDCTHALCRVFDLYTYEIASLDEYREHLAGVDLYARHHAHTLRLDKEGLRRQVAASIEKQLGERYAKKKWAPDKVTRLMTSGLARAEERTLHLTDDVTYGKEKVGEWALSIQMFMQGQQEDATQKIYQAELRTLFDEIVLHAGGAAETVALVHARGSN